MQGEMPLITEAACRQRYPDFNGGNVWSATDSDFSTFFCAGNSDSHATQICAVGQTIIYNSLC